MAANQQLQNSAFPPDTNRQRQLTTLCHCNQEIWGLLSLKIQLQHNSNITKQFNPSGNREWVKQKTKESKESCCSSESLKSKKLEQNGDSAATNFINVTPKDSGGKGYRKSSKQ
nr:CMF_HP1_G0046380.mRNA.1.CDS.1 [Saccharomyces cerevisiae]